MNKKNDFKKFLIGLIVLILYFLSSFFSDFIFIIFNIDYNNLPIILKSLYNILYDISRIGIIVYIFRNEIFKSVKTFVKNNSKYFNKYIKYWFIALALMIVCNLVITQIIGLESSNNQKEIINIFKKYPIYTFIVTVFLAPIIEELVFRLSIRYMISKTNWLYIIISGLLFGSMHVITSATNFKDYLFIIPYSIPGIVFAYTLVKSKNVCVPISLHFIHNGFLMLLQILLLFK